MSFTSKNDTYLEHSEGFLITAAWKTGVLMALLLTVLPTPAAAAPSAPILSVSGWAVLLGVGIGAGAVGLLHWIRLRHVREQAAGRVEALRAEKEEAEEALDAATDRAEKRKEISEAKSAFLEEVSHAFRRPLTLTLGPIDALLEGRHGSLSEEVRTQLRLAQQNGTRVLWLAGQLMDLAELETGSMTLSATEDNLPAFVSRSLRSFEDLAERRGVSLGFESSLDDPTVSYDEEKMETMLANLLSSAFRAAGEGGRVRVSLHPAPVESGEGSDVELRLEHGGSDLEAGLDGMPFDWARDEDVRQKPGNVSANVGLYLADQLADLHGGELWTGGELQTAGELQTGGGADKTSAFIVRLPRQPSTCEEARPDSIPQTRGDTIPRFRDETDERGALELSRRALASTPVRKDGSSPPGPTVSPNLTERGPTRKGSTKEGPIPGEEVLPGPGAPARHAPSRSDSLSGADGPADEDARADADRTTVLVIDDNSVICTLVRSHLEPEYRVEEA
ncbi:MAG: sensor histidine kinase, partial [Salinibacter sp.]